MFKPTHRVCPQVHHIRRRRDRVCHDQRSEGEAQHLVWPQAAAHVDVQSAQHDRGVQEHQLGEKCHRVPGPVQLRQQYVEMVEGQGRVVRVRADGGGLGTCC